MKKSNTFLFTILLAVMTFSLTVFAQQQFRLIINNRDVKCDMIVKDGTTYLPLRTISNELGLDLQFKDGVIILNTSSSTPSVITTQQTTENKPTIEQPISQQPVNQIDNTNLTSDEVLDVANLSAKNALDIYKTYGTITIEKSPYMIDEDSAKYVTKLVKGKEIIYEETSVHILNHIGCRELLKYGKTDKPRVYTIETRELKREINPDYKEPSLIGQDENGNFIWLGDK